MDENR
jgi:hypothetical protein